MYIDHTTKVRKGIAITGGTQPTELHHDKELKYHDTHFRSLKSSGRRVLGPRDITVKSTQPTISYN
jgi:hypothetical protein